MIGFRSSAPAKRVGRSSCIRPRLPSPVRASVRTCSSSALVSLSLIASLPITAVIVAAQSTVERPLAALKYCIAKRPIIVPAKTAGTTISRRSSPSLGDVISSAAVGCQTEAPRQTAAIR